MTEELMAPKFQRKEFRNKKELVEQIISQSNSNIIRLKRANKFFNFMCEDYLENWKTELKELSNIQLKIDRTQKSDPEEKSRKQEIKRLNAWINTAEEDKSTMLEMIYTQIKNEESIIETIYKDD